LGASGKLCNELQIHHTSEVAVRRATPAELAALVPGDGRPTAKAWVGALDGRIVGFGGLAFRQGRWIAFCELSEEARPYKRAIVRAGRAVIDEVRRAGHRFVYAQVDGSEPMARRWLESLGFQPDSKTRLYRWQA
jgi:hypothetical protein